jgi:hypothetical protein
MRSCVTLRFPTRKHAGSGYHTPSRTVGRGGFSLKVKRLEREAEFSPPRSAKIKNERSCNSTSSYPHMSCKDNFKYKLELLCQLGLYGYSSF